MCMQCQVLANTHTHKSTPVRSQNCLAWIFQLSFVQWKTTPRKWQNPTSIAVIPGGSESIGGPSPRKAGIPRGNLTDKTLIPGIQLEVDIFFWEEFGWICWGWILAVLYTMLSGGNHKSYGIGTSRFSVIFLCMADYHSSNIEERMMWMRIDLEG